MGGCVTEELPTLTKQRKIDQYEQVRVISKRRLSVKNGREQVDGATVEAMNLGCHVESGGDDGGSN